MMKLRIVLPLIVLLLVLPYVSIEASEVFVGASEAVVIRPSGESEEGRLLMKFSLPEVLEACEAIDFACVSVDVDCSGEKDAVSFEAFAVTTAWDGGSVSWSEPWTEAGGDWDDEMSVDWIVSEGSGKTVYLDITDLVNGWLKEPSQNFGIIVKVSEPFTGTFSVNKVQAPTLRIVY